jgi:hypothetical protein
MAGRSKNQWPGLAIEVRIHKPGQTFGTGWKNRLAANACLYARPSASIFRFTGI